MMGVIVTPCIAVSRWCQLPQFWPRPSADAPLDAKEPFDGDGLPHGE